MVDQQYQHEFIIDEFDQKHVFANGWFEKWLKITAQKADQRKVQQLLIVDGIEPERSSEPVMRKADMSRTDEGVTVLESGQTITHHRKEQCEGIACALHNTMDGPWEDWPRFYNVSNGGIYRVCPHTVAHPAVEQVVYWLTADKEDLIPHMCCTQGCVCMPHRAVPASYFDGGRRVGIPISLFAWAEDSQKPEEDDEEEETSEPAVITVPHPVVHQLYGDDPNKWAAALLSGLRSTISPALHELLVGRMMEHHHINKVRPSGAGDYAVVCNDKCNVDLHRNEDGDWENLEENFCPTVEIALLAGWRPVEWHEEGTT